MTLVFPGAAIVLLLELNDLVCFFLLKLHLTSVVFLLSVSKSCLTVSDSMDYSRPGSSVHGILQAGMLEWLPFPSPGDLPEPGIEPHLLLGRQLLCH